MIQEIKTIVQNYLSNAKLCNLMLGTCVADGIKISDKLIIPLELIEGNLKAFTSIGDKVRLIRNHGGQEFYIVEIIGLPMATKSRTLSIEPITFNEGMTISSITINEVIK